MELTKKTVAAMLVMILIFGISGSLKAEAAAKLKAPKITVETTDDGDAVTITVSKTKNAAGYEIYGLYPGEYNFERIMDLKKNGKSARTVTIKDLGPGTYTFKVQAYKTNKNQTKSYSAFSDEETIEIKTAVYSAGKLGGDFSKVKKGDILIFGSYEQDFDENYDPVKKPIEWIVYDKTDDQMLLVSKYVLDAMPYNEEWKDVTWEKCSLRKWLNKEFYKTAFSKAERAMIKTVTLKNPDNKKTGASGGKNTKDKIFILSRDDLVNPAYGYDPDPVAYDHGRRCSATNYAIYNMGYLPEEAAKVSTWWLRTPGKSAANAANVDEDDTVNEYGHAVRDGDGVRPALYIKIK